MPIEVFVPFDLWIEFNPVENASTRTYEDVEDNNTPPPPVLVPGISVTPNPLNFGSETVGETVGPLNLTITNTGTGLLTVTGIGVSGDFSLE